MVNWGQIIAWAGVTLSVGAAIGYAFARDYRHALYFALGAAITVVAMWR